MGPFKFTYKELEKQVIPSSHGCVVCQLNVQQGVIVDSEVPEFSRKACKWCCHLSLNKSNQHINNQHKPNGVHVLLIRFVGTFMISSDSYGVFNIVAKMAGLEVEQMTLEVGAASLRKTETQTKQNTNKNNLVLTAHC